VINNNITIMMVDGCWWNNPNLHFDLMLWYKNHINKRKSEMMISYFIMDLNQQVKWLKTFFIEDLEKHDFMYIWCDLWCFYANVPYAMNQKFTTTKSCSYFIFVHKFKLVTWKQHYKTPPKCKIKQLLLKEKKTY
jgi:hypothetical protein